MSYDDLMPQTHPHTFTDEGLNMQLRLPLKEQPSSLKSASPNVEVTLKQLLAQDLSFEGQKSNYATHNLHAFAAKFPPQLPRLFIQELTAPGEIVFDPMVGSGTVLVEAMLANRRSIGIDLDPLSILLARTKTTPLNLFDFLEIANAVLEESKANWCPLDTSMLRRVYSSKAIEFFEYWFEPRTISELFALLQSIQRISEPQFRSALEMIFSSTIITKNGGLSRARDLAHSRPHRDHEKQITRSAFDVFQERLILVTRQLDTISGVPDCAYIVRGDVRQLPLRENCVDLIFTSPPYAANAIDYMRAHKFSLTWLGYAPEALSELRARYIGSERHSSAMSFASETANGVLHQLNQIDGNRASVVAHYFVEMEISLREMLRVLAIGRAAILVVGTSTIRGVDIEVSHVLRELAESVGFKIVGVSTRAINRNARMMPVSHNSQRGGIEARMHEESIIGLIKL